MMPITLTSSPMKSSCSESGRPKRRKPGSVSMAIFEMLVCLRLGARAELAGDPCLLALAGSLQNDPAEVVREAGIAWTVA